MARFISLPPRRKMNGSCSSAFQALAGLRFGELAARAQLPIPKDLKRRDKGWQGMR